VPTPGRNAESVDLSAVLREALARNRLLAPETEGEAPGVQAALRLTRDIEDDLRIDGYRLELARVLDNLLGNALRYGRDANGQLDLEVALHRVGEEAVLSIADRGPGIAGGEIARLVRPFERGDTSRSGAVGAGLGLAIVERVIRLHHARITYGVNAPQGLRVEIRIPLVAVAPAAAPGPAAVG
jgi:two-component system osmolarity sensor histidine kinase EnvZ